MGKAILKFVVVLLLLLSISGCSDMGVRFDIVKEDVGEKGSVFILFDSTSSFIGIDEKGDAYYYIVEDFNFTEHKVRVKQKLFNIKEIRR